MSKRVLILSSSPRKGGNSETLCDRFEEGATAAGNSVEKVVLSQENIHYCTGCYGCRKNGKCVQKDDMAALLDSMTSADVLVLATPVYFYSMCAQLKTVIDRTVARYTKLSGKEFYFILTAAVNDKKSLERTVEGLRGFTACLPGAKEKGIVYGTGAWEKGEIRSTPAMQLAYTMGKSV